VVTSQETQESVINETIVEQEKFYRDKYGLVILITLLVAVIGAILAGLIFLLHSTVSPPPTYFKASELHQLIEEVPLDQAGIENNILLNWVTEAVMVSNTFNFVSNPRVIDESIIYFTKDGYDSYKNAFVTNKIIDRVNEKKLVLKATAKDAPQILLEKPLAGRYMWKIKIPMNFRYQSVTTDVSDTVDITMIVMRVPTVESPNGVLILKYDLEVLGRG
jgi:hypothetical protein